MYRLLLTAVVVLLSSRIYASAQCLPSTHSSQAIGVWELAFATLGEFEKSTLVLSHKNGFWQGALRVNGVDRSGIPVQACEGDCCNGFFERRGTINLWAQNADNFLKTKGRVALIFDSIDWKSGKAMGQIMDHNFESVSGFTAKKKTEP